MLSFYKLRTERQDNGLWGTPLKLKSIDGNIIFKDEEKEKLFSAIIMAFAETKEENFSLEMIKDIFIIHTESRTYYYGMSYFGLDDDKLYHLPTDDDKKVFNRMIKLKKITKKEIF
jgi:hypothetical protein